MFAPESVFDKPSPKPRGFYHPSPYTKQAEINDNMPEITASINSQNLHYKKANLPSVGSNIRKISSKNSVLSGELELEGKNSRDSNVYKENAATSVDDLIRDIDKDLEVRPDVNLPVACTKIDVGNILSVSDNSDTNANVPVMSPKSLRYYMDRFKYSEPSHPSQRIKSLPEQRQIFEKPVNKSSSISNESDPDYSSVLLDTASFLDVVVSSDDTTAGSFSSGNFVDLNDSPNLKIRKSHNMIGMNQHDLSDSKQQASHIKSLTGKSFSELAYLVPKTILNPANESEDILYQWRLKQKIMQAHTTSLQHEIQFVPDYIVPQSILSGTANQIKRCNSVEKPKKGATTREVQTDAEKTETACQADIILPLKKCNLEHIIIHNEPVVNKCHVTDDSCSEISISSVSSGDLTNISQLDDIEITNYVLGEDNSSAINDDKASSEALKKSADTDCIVLAPRKLVTTPSNNNIVIEDHNTQIFTDLDKVNDTNPDTVADSDLDLNNIQNILSEKYILSHDSQGHNLNRNAAVSIENSDELKFHLENIKESFDDELLSVFIDKYTSVVEQIKVIEEAIKQKCNED